HVSAGAVEPADGGNGVFKSASGVFQAVPGPGVVRGSGARLYVRPEHARLQASPGQGNSLPVTVSTVAFEGNFINVHLIDDHSGPRIVQKRKARKKTTPR